MKRLTTVLIMLFCCLAFESKAQFVYAVGSAPPVSTQLADVRYEFVQSATNSAQSFLVDKYLGKVWRVNNKRKDFEEVLRDFPDSVDTNRVNYQLYISATNSALCYLLNVHTGEMWKYSSEVGYKIFEKMEMPLGIKKED